VKLTTLDLCKRVCSCASNPKIQANYESVKGEFSDIKIEFFKKYYHSGVGIRGSIYLKILEDPAFLHQTLSRDFFLTTIFTSYLTRQISPGRLKTLGKVVNRK
jgi:hypothetical protein